MSKHSDSEEEDIRKNYADAFESSQACFRFAEEIRVLRQELLALKQEKRKWLASSTRHDDEIASRDEYIRRLKLELLQLNEEICENRKQMNEKEAISLVKKDEHKLLELNLQKMNLNTEVLKEALKKEAKKVKSLQKELMQAKDENTKLKADCCNSKVELESALKTLGDNKSTVEGVTSKYQRIVEDFNQRSENQICLTEKVTGLFQLMSSVCESSERAEADEWLSTHGIGKDGRSLEPLETGKIIVLIHATRMMLKRLLARHERLKTYTKKLVHTIQHFDDDVDKEHECAVPYISGDTLSGSTSRNKNRMPSKKEPEDPAVVTEALNSSVLTDMVNNLEATKLKLLLEIKELKEKLDQQKEDQSDIYYYLNKKCDESFEVIASLEEQILNEQADREIAEKLYETKIEELKAAATSNDLKLNSKISDLENRLEMLNAFSETKDETEQNLKNLMTKLEEERIQFSVNAESMENKFLMEREKLRKSYDVKYENIKKELEQSVDGKLTKKTKKTQIMNIIMKKELDSQSKHAEKLLEINQNILNKDRELKLELELSTSLQNEMTNKLAMYQRMIKQVNEKVASQEQVIEEMQKDSQQKLTDKCEEIVRLEAKINQMNKKLSRENSKMDEMWKFLSNSYQLIKNKNINEAVQHKDHELLLVELIREIASKYPKALGPLLQPLAGFANGGGSSFEGDHNSSSFEVASSMSSVVNAGGAFSAINSAGGTTGIPSWDANHQYKSGDPRKGSKSSRSLASSNTRSVACQTEGRVSAYPQGSVWLDGLSVASSVGASGAAAGATVHTNNNRLLVGTGLGYAGTGTVMKPSALLYNQNNHLLSNSSVTGGSSSGFDGYSGGLLNDRSIDMHSMPTVMHNPNSLWGPAATVGLDGGNSMALTSSIASDAENYTIKSANYALQMPSNPANAKTKAIAKMRSKKFGGSDVTIADSGMSGNRNSLGGSAAMQFRDLDQIIQDTSGSSNAGKKKKYLAISGGAGGKQSQVMTVHTSLDDAPSRLYGLNNNNNINSSGGEMLLTKSFTGGSGTLRGAGAMSVSGQAFANGPSNSVLLPRL